MNLLAQSQTCSRNFFIEQSIPDAHCANQLPWCYCLFYLWPQRLPSLWCDPVTRLWLRGGQPPFPARPGANLSPLSSGNERVARWGNCFGEIYLFLCRHWCLHAGEWITFLYTDINFAIASKVKYANNKEWPKIWLKGSNQGTAECDSVPHTDEVVICHQSAPVRPAESLSKRQCHVLR